MAKEGNKNARTLARMKPAASGTAADENDMQEIEDGTPDEGSSLGEAFKQAAEALLQSAQSLNQVGTQQNEGLHALAQAILAPSRAIRGPDGRIAGSEKVLGRVN